MRGGWKSGAWPDYQARRVVRRGGFSGVVSRLVAWKEVNRAPETGPSDELGPMHESCDQAGGGADGHIAVTWMLAIT